MPIQMESNWDEGVMRCSGSQNETSTAEVQSAISTDPQTISSESNQSSDKERDLLDYSKRDFVQTHVDESNQLDHSSPLDQNAGTFNTSCKQAEKYFVYFWREEDVYSQWFESKFVVDDTRYSCAEQYMMHKKAELFHDDDLAKKILKCNRPRNIKSLGRKTKQFDADLWMHNSLYVVKDGNMAKFSQNDVLKEMLFDTYPRVLVEASPYDKIWGIGVKKSDQCAWNEATWEGKNLLGFILTEVRDELMFNEGRIKESEKKVYLEKLFKKLKENNPWGSDGNIKTKHKHADQKNTWFSRNKNQNPQRVCRSSVPVEQAVDAVAELNINDDNSAIKDEPFEITASERKDMYPCLPREEEMGCQDTGNSDVTPITSRREETSAGAGEIPPEDRLYKPQYRASITEKK